MSKFLANEWNKATEEMSAFFEGMDAKIKNAQDNTVDEQIWTTPKLLEALKIALHRADQARYHTAENIEPITAEWLEGIISAARAAIAKAQG